MAALETKEQIPTSQLSFDYHEIKELCFSQFGKENTVNGAVELELGQTLPHKQSQVAVCLT